jgi:hypothetical protein
MKDGRRFGGPPKPYRPPATPAGKVNLTDPDSKNVKTPRGYMQGYNAQAVVTAGQVVIAAEINSDSPDFGHLEPMISSAQAELAGAGVSEAPKVVLAGAGYWHQQQMEAIVDRALQVLIPPDAGKRKGTRPGWDGGLYAFMRRVLSTDHGGALYARRRGMIEPVFAHTKFNRRADRFQRRGRAACRSEWRLITATHNLLKLWKHTTAPVAASQAATAARGPDRRRARKATAHFTATSHCAALRNSHHAKHEPRDGSDDRAVVRAFSTSSRAARFARRRRRLRAAASGRPRAARHAHERLPSIRQSAHTSTAPSARRPLTARPESGAAKALRPNARSSRPPAAAQLGRPPSMDAARSAPRGTSAWRSSSTSVAAAGHEGLGRGRGGALVVHDEECTDDVLAHPARATAAAPAPCRPHAHAMHTSVDHDGIAETDLARCPSRGSATFLASSLSGHPGAPLPKLLTMEVLYRLS